jgi:hypothetical protein
MQQIYTVIVAKDVTRQLPGEDPFAGHYIHRMPATPSHPDGRRIVVRCRRTSNIGWALRYWRIWRKQAKQDPRYGAFFRVGVVHHLPAAHLARLASVAA